MTTEKTDKQRKLEALLLRQWTTVGEAMMLAGCYALSQRFGELKRGGEYVCDSRWVTLTSGARVKQYRIYKLQAVKVPA